ncbi:MAG: hypothetical protein P8J87_03565, partial [Verrucomicrobiales bacterium]|nr:hypothetical protein [Verrucomicrobiales bacterium]
MNEDERSKLIDAVLDRSISEADFLRLEAELTVNADARQAYYARLKLHTALGSESESFTPAAAPEPEIISFKPLLAVAAAIALTASAAIIGWLAGNNNETPNIATKAEPAATGFAVLAEQSGAQWESNSQLNRGDLLPEGELHLKTGTAQLDLFSGVTVIVEGDARFEIISPMEMAVHQGKVRALVPEPAHGFRITTATG